MEAQQDDLTKFRQQFQIQFEFSPLFLPVSTNENEDRVLLLSP